MTFAELGLNSPLLQALGALGYENPTPVQAQAIPLALAGHDLIASANTGTGKTAAFVLPALQRIAQPAEARPFGPRVLVLSPTRELAGQILTAARRYATGMRCRSGSVVGGMPYSQQLKMLSQPLDLLVATPGRLIDHLDRRKINLSSVELLVLDEADRMLDMGFIEAVERIAAACPSARQTFLFTATWDGRLSKLAGGLMREPKRVDIAGGQIENPSIAQRVLRIDDHGHKKRLLNHLLADREVEKAIVFVATKADTETLAGELVQMGHAAGALHGDMKQSFRDRTIRKLRTGETKILVATDVAARGLDISDISHVVNFDLPMVADDYVHRIGRTGRAGATGTAWSLVGRRDIRRIKEIEQRLGMTLTFEVIPGLEPKESGSRDDRRGAPRGPKRFDGPRRPRQEGRPERNEGRFGGRAERDDRRSGWSPLPERKDAPEARAPRNSERAPAARADHAGSDAGLFRKRAAGATRSKRWS